MARKGRILVVAAVATVLVLGFAVALAQQGQGRQQRGGAGWGGGQGPGPGAPMGPMAGPMMMRAMAPPAIAVAGGKVFIAAGGKLYRFDAETLELEAEADYAPMGPMPMGPGVPGGPPPGEGGMLPPPQPPGQ